eukprot:jgi/Tetstr1/424840/TSEL_015343.t1
MAAATATSGNTEEQSTLEGNRRVPQGRLACGVSARDVSPRQVLWRHRRGAGEGSTIVKWVVAWTHRGSLRGQLQRQAAVPHPGRTSRNAMAAVSKTVSIKDEKSGKSIGSNIGGTPQRSSSPGLTRKASDKFFSLAIANLAKDQSKRTAKERKESSRSEHAEAKRRVVVEEWWHILESSDEPPVRVSSFVKLWELFGGKAFTAEQRSVLMRYFRCGTSSDRAIKFAQFEAFCLQQLKVQREMRQRGQASSLTRDDYTIMGLMPIQSVFVAAKRNLVMLSFFNGDFGRSDLTWQVPDSLLNHSAKIRGFKSTRTLAANRWKAAGVMALEQERSTGLDPRRGRGNALRMGRGSEAQGKVTAAELEWPALPTVQSQLREMGYTSPAAWVPAAAPQAPLLGSGDTADNPFADIAPMVERAGVRAGMTAPLVHARDPFTRPTSHAPLQRDGHYSLPVSSLAEICRPTLNTRTTCDNSRTQTSASTPRRSPLRNTWGPRPTSVPASSRVARSWPATARSAKSTPGQKITRNPSFRGRKQTPQGASPARPGTVPDDSFRPQLHGRPQTSDADRFNPAQPPGIPWGGVSSAQGIRPGTAPVPSSSEQAPGTGDDRALWAERGGGSFGREAMVPIPEGEAVREGDSGPDGEGKQGEPAWLNWAVEHKGWALTAETEGSMSESSDDDDSYEALLYDDQSWDGDSSASGGGRQALLPDRRQRSASHAPAPRQAPAGVARLELQTRPATSGPAPQAWLGPSMADERFSFRAIKQGLQNKVNQKYGPNISNGRYSGYTTASRQNWALRYDDNAGAGTRGWSPAPEGDEWEELPTDRGPALSHEGAAE